MMARECNLREIQDLANKNMEASNKANDAQENLKQLIHKVQQQGTIFNDMAVQNKTVRFLYLKTFTSQQDKRVLSSTPLVLC